MNMVKKIFYLFAFVLLVAPVLIKAQTPLARQLNSQEIDCLDTKLPLTLSKIDYDVPGKDLPDVVTNKIKEIIAGFYIENGIDSGDITTVKNCYFHTLRVPLNAQELFIVVLQTPLSYSHCKLFLYDTLSKAVSKTVVDYNTWAMYAIDDNNMNPSNLVIDLHIKGPDISLTGIKRDIQLKRLKHDGTFNELEKITYRANGIKLDTVSYDSDILYQKE